MSSFASAQLEFDDGGSRGLLYLVESAFDFDRIGEAFSYGSAGLLSYMH